MNVNIGSTIFEEDEGDSDEFQLLKEKSSNLETDSEEDSTTVETDSLGNEDSQFTGKVDADTEADQKLEDGKTLNEIVIEGSNVQKIQKVLSVKAQEPWPKDVKLFQPYEVEQILLPDNANCLAVQAYLKMCCLDFQVERRSNAESMSPSGRVPFIKVGRFVVADLEGIMNFVNNKGLSQLTKDFDAEKKSGIRAYMSLIHNVLEMAELYICWYDKETYSEVTSVRNGSIYPWPLNHFQNWSKRNEVLKKLKILGWYKKTMSQVLQEVETCCQALSDHLEGKPYFYGDGGVSHVIFDMDGTLVDTESVYGQIISNIAAKFGVVYTEEIRLKAMGTVQSETSKICVKEMNLPITPEEFDKQLETSARESLKGVALMPGVDKIVRHLHENNIPIAVATSSSSEFVEIKSSTHKELFSFFHHIVASGDDPEVKHGKPAPDVFLICASRFPDEPKPEKCLVFEDSPNGVVGAIAAGMQVVMVTPSTMSEEISKIVTLKLNSLEELQPELFALPPFM